MRIDMILLAALALFGALGVASGAIKQFTKLLGLAVALVGAKPLAEQLTPLVMQKVSAPEFLVNTGLAMLTFPFLYFTTSLISLLILNRAFRDHVLSKTDRVIGFFLGGGKAAAISWVALSGVVLFQPTIAEKFKDDYSVAFVKEYNFFRTFQVEQVEELRKLAEKSNANPGLQALMDSNQDPNQLLNNPEIQKLLADPKIQAQIKQLPAGSK